MSRKKHKAPQLEINWGEPEAFTLVVEQTLDGERIAREKAEKDTNLNQAEQKQIPLA